MFIVWFYVPLPHVPLLIRIFCQCCKLRVFALKNWWRDPIPHQLDTRQNIMVSSFCRFGPITPFTGVNVGVRRYFILRGAGSCQLSRSRGPRHNSLHREVRGAPPWSLRQDDHQALEHPALPMLHFINPPWGMCGNTRTPPT